MNYQDSHYRCERLDLITLRDAIEAYLDNPLSYGIGLTLRIKLIETGKWKNIPRLEMSKARIDQRMFKFLVKNRLVV